MQIMDLNINKSQQACLYTEKSHYNIDLHLSHDWQETPGNSVSQWKSHTPIQNDISQYPLTVKLQFKEQQIPGCFPNHEKRVAMSLSNSKWLLQVYKSVLIFYVSYLKT